MDSSDSQRLVGSSVTFRRARTSDVGLLRRWSHADHVRDVIGDAYDWDWPTEVESGWQEVWIASIREGKVRLDIGVVIVLNTEADPSHYWGDVEPGTYAIDLWIGESNALHRGFGAAMMRYGIDRAFQVHGANVILLDPIATNTAAIGFYRHMGFQDVGPRRFGTDQCLVLQLHNPHHPHTFPPDSGGNAHTPPDSGGSNADPPESGGNG